MKKLNIKFIAILMVSLLVAAVTVKGVHDFQVSRQADKLLNQANAAEEQGDLEMVVDALRRYLAYRPKEFEKKTRMATTYVSWLNSSETSSSGERKRALEFIERALADDSDNPELHWAAAQLLIRLGVAADALPHLNHVKDALKSKPDLQLASHAPAPGKSGKASKASAANKKVTIGQVEFDICRAMLGNSQKEEALKTLLGLLGYTGEIANYDPTQVPDVATPEAYQLLASLLTQDKQDTKGARLVMDHMVTAMTTLNDRPAPAGISEDEAKSLAAAKSEALAQAHLARAQYLALEPNHEELQGQIGIDIAAAEKLAPDNPDVLAMTAQFALNQGNVEKAIATLDQGIATYPDNSVMYRLRSDAARMQGKLDEAAKVLDQGLEHMRNDANLTIIRTELQVMMRDLEGLDKSLARLKEIHINPDLIDFFQAEKLIIEEKLGDALKILKRVRTSLPDRFKNRAGLLEIACANALKQETTVSPDSGSGIDLQYQYALNEESMGFSDKALVRFQAVLKELQKNTRLSKDMRDKFEIEVKTRILENQIALQRRLSEKDRRWDDVKATAKELLASPLIEQVRKDGLQLSIIINAGNMENARKYANTCLQKHPDDEGIWYLALQTQPDFATANAFLDKMEAKFKDSVQLRARRADIIGRFRPSDGPERLQQLIQNTDGFQPAQVLALRLQVGTALAMCGDVNGAYAMWKKVAEEQPKKDVDLQIRLLRVALDQKWDADVEQWSKAISDQTGPESDESKYVKALRIVIAAHQAREQNKPIDAQQLQEARQICVDALRARPRWDEMLKIAADIELINGDPARAMDLLSDLNQVRPGDPTVITPLVSLLVRADKLVEALAILQEAGSGVQTLDLARLKLTALEKLERYEEALDTMRELLKTNEFSPEFRIGLGRLLNRTKRYPEAEKVLREFVQTHSERPEGWEELMKVLMAQDRKVEAENVLLDAQLKLQGNPLMANFVRAKGATVLGDAKQAEQAYRELAELLPNDMSVLQIVATYFLDHDQPKVAREYVEKMLARPDVPETAYYSAWARRKSASLIVDSGLGSYADFLAALDLLQKNAKGGELEGEDLQMYLRLAANRIDVEHQGKAFELIQKLEKKRPLTNEEKFVKAQLMLARNDWTGYKSTMTSLLTDKAATGEFWNHWITNLLKRDEMTLARQWFGKYPANGRGRIPLELELLVREGRAQDAAERVKALIPPDAELAKGNNSTMLLQLAHLTEDLAKYEPKMLGMAESLVAKFVKLKPAEQLELARFHGRQWEKLGTALDECEKMAAQSDASAAASIGEVVVRSLRAHETRLKPDSPELVRGATLVQELRKKDPNSYDLMLQEAEITELRQQADAAVAIYKNLIDNEAVPDVYQAQVMNNLAYRLYLQGKNEEALPHIDKAIKVLGTRPDLLDTRAVINMALDHLDVAVTDLRTASELTDEPLIWFHLAQAEQRGGHQEEAVRAFQAAKTLGLDPEKLDQTDRKAYDAVRAALEPLLPKETVPEPTPTSAG